MVLWRKTSVRAVMTVIGILTLLVATRIWYLNEQGNFHTVTTGEAYRSAQLDRDELEHYIRKYNIRSIINLRDEHPDENWYREEILTAENLKVIHFDFGGIGTSRPPEIDSVSKLLTLFATAPRPILLHCMAGADRSGLAAAIWKVAIDGTSISEAKKQLSLRYGHMPIGPTQVLDTFFDSWSSNRDISATLKNKENSPVGQ